MPHGAELLRGGAASKAPATVSPPPSIGNVFQKVLDEIHTAHATSIAKSAEPDKAQAQLSAVDIELNFKSVVVSESGWVLFGKDTKESQLEIRLATRIHPPS